MKARSVQTAMRPGEKVVFQQMYDYYADVYDGPHAFKAAEGSKTDFKPSTHFINKLPADEKERFIASKVKVLQKVMVDAMVMHGHEGADDTTDDDARRDAEDDRERVDAHGPAEEQRLAREKMEICADLGMENLEIPAMPAALPQIGALPLQDMTAQQTNQPQRIDNSAVQHHN